MLELVGVVCGGVGERGGRWGLRGGSGGGLTLSQQPLLVVAIDHVDHVLSDGCLACLHWTVCDHEALLGTQTTSWGFGEFSAFAGDASCCFALRLSGFASCLLDTVR